jgi:hypothetical protein
MWMKVRAGLQIEAIHAANHELWSWITSGYAEAEYDTDSPGAFYDEAHSEQAVAIALDAAVARTFDDSMGRSGEPGHRWLPALFQRLEETNSGNALFHVVRSLVARRYEACIVRWLYSESRMVPWGPRWVGGHGASTSVLSRNQDDWRHRSIDLPVYTTIWMEATDLLLGLAGTDCVTILRTHFDFEVAAAAARRQADGAALAIPAATIDIPLIARRAYFVNSASGDLNVDNFTQLACVAIGSGALRVLAWVLEKLPALAIERAPALAAAMALSGQLAPLLPWFREHGGLGEFNRLQAAYTVIVMFPWPRAQAQLAALDTTLDACVRAHATVYLSKSYGADALKRQTEHIARTLAQRGRIDTLEELERTHFITGPEAVVPVWCACIQSECPETEWMEGRAPSPVVVAWSHRRGACAFHTTVVTFGTHGHHYLRRSESVGISADVTVYDCSSLNLPSSRLADMDDAALVDYLQSTNTEEFRELVTVATRAALTTQTVALCCHSGRTRSIAVARAVIKRVEETGRLVAHVRLE